jgi:antitoxin (DNA-binding transcriptional repressor) of toxin-antitoxin stability system
MEKSLGIEAARARLGDIADHARTTGQVTALTRHGRTVAVIGPAHAVQPAGSIKVTLYLGDDDQVCVLPALPRIGESFLVETADGNEEYWLVTNIQWDLRPDEEPSVNVLCDPSDDYSAWIAANRPSANEK